MHAYDLLIRNGLVVNGTGGEPFEADVGIRGNRIAAVGKLPGGGRAGVRRRLPCRPRYRMAVSP